MLQFFRNAFKSKIGAGIALGVLFLIALAFASGDVANNGGFGGVAGGDRVAIVGKDRIDTSTLAQAATNALERVKQEDPKISMKAFLANGGLDRVLGDLTDRLAVAEFGKTNGIVASDRLVDSEIIQIGAFHGADGKFSEDIFRQAIQQRGISEKMLRDDLQQGLIAKQVMIPAGAGAVVPLDLVKRYAALLGETREGEIAVLPSLLFANKDEADEKAIEAYYKKNSNRFIRPERRVIRYVSFGDEIVKDLAAPTASEIAFRFKSNKSAYEAKEKRRITQVILPTEAAAKALASEVQSGTSLEQAANSKGLAANKLESFARSELASQFSEQVAKAVFSTPKGQIAAPAKSALGWHVMRTEEIDSRPAKSLDDVRDELAAEIKAEKMRVALNETLERVEDEFADGANLTEVAQSLGLELTETAPLTADGKVYAKDNETAPPVLSRVVETAFSMEQEEPQIAEVVRGKTFVIYDVTDITPSAPAPLKEIKGNVEAAYLMEQASKEAKSVARDIQAKVAKGQTLNQALATLNKRLPPVETIRMTRPQLAQIQQQQGGMAPPPIAMMFNMAEGTVKSLSGQGGQVWFVVALKKITPGQIPEDAAALRGPQRELSTIAGSEYADALGRAVRKEVGVEINDAAVKAVRVQLGGES